MDHRHLNHERLTLAAIDDIIDRGGRHDWADLRRAMLLDVAVAERVFRVCAAHIDDQYAQRYHFWDVYAKHYLA